MENTNKKSKVWKWVLSGFVIATIAAGAGVGIGYAIWHNRNNTTLSTDAISFGKYQASMTSVGSHQTISARSSEGKPVTLSAESNGQDTASWFTFIIDHNDTNAYILTYIAAVTTTTTVTITAKEDDSIATPNSINIDLLPPTPIPETSFNVSCANPNLTYGTTNTLSLTWNSANFTPTSITLKDGDSNDKWSLKGGNPVTSTSLTLLRKSNTLALGQYNVTFVASDGTNNKEAIISVTVTMPIPNNKYIGIKEDGEVVIGDIASTITLSNLPLTVLYIPTNTVVNTLYCEQDKLQALDVSGCTNLKLLHCNENQLTSLVVSNNANLESLICDQNSLTSLDVSGCTNLTYLSCTRNFFTSLVVSVNSKLDQLYCTENPHLNNIKLPKTPIAHVIFDWFSLTGIPVTCAANGVVTVGSNTTINSTKPDGWDTTTY